MSFQFALITPSYAPDFKRCRLLCQSVEKFISPSVPHYVIVEQRDLPLFRQIQSSNTEILSVESVLPWWIKRLPLIKKGWFSFKTFPVRNWINQQLVKIAFSTQIDKDVLVFVDSDTFFIRPCNLQSFIREDKVRLFRIPNEGKVYKNLKWHRSAGHLLGLPPMDYSGARYISNVITWRRENVIKLCEHLEKISGQGWLETLCNTWNLSEYILYGVFIDKILQEQSGHYYDEQNICHEYWASSGPPMSDEELQSFFSAIRPEQVAVMISSKVGMSVAEYEKFLNQIT